MDFLLMTVVSGSILYGTKFYKELCSNENEP
jgi:hypothetical protein